MPDRARLIRTGRAFASLASLLLAVLVFSSWQAAVTPLIVSVSSALLVAIAAAGPVWGLCVLAVALPLATPLSLWSGGSLGQEQYAELLILSWLLGACVRFAINRGAQPLRLSRPALVLGCVIAAGIVVGLLVEQRATAWPAVYLASLGRHLRNSYFARDPVFAALHNGMPWLEGLALAVFAERAIRAAPARAILVLHALLAGAILNSVFTWKRVIEVSVRHSYTLRELGGFLLHQRLSSLYPDLNAAGSIYAMYFVAAVWLALRGPKVWRWAWLAALAVLLPLWVSGSRSAQMAAVIGLAAAWLVTKRVSGRALAMGAALVVVLVAAVVFWSPGRTAQSSARLSFDVRWQMARIAGHFIAERPMFGIGLGTFREASAPYITPELAAVFPQAAHGENAHNNYLQILAEAGLVGFLSFAWVAAAAAAGVVAGRRSGQLSPSLVALAAAVLTFLVTCLGGHPFLLREILWLFFLTLGITASLAPPPDRALANAWPSRLTAALVLIVLASVPVRVWQSRQTADLDHVVIGASHRMDTDSDRVYRLADAESAWYVTSTVNRIEIPLRLTADSQGPCLVRVDVESHPADAIRVASDAWSTLTVRFVPTRRTPASRRVDLHVDGAACHLMVGEFGYKQ